MMVCKALVGIYGEINKVQEATSDSVYKTINDMAGLRGRGGTVVEAKKLCMKARGAGLRAFVRLVRMENKFRRQLKPAYLSARETDSLSFLFEYFTEVKKSLLVRDLAIHEAYKWVRPQLTLNSRS